MNQENITRTLATGQSDITRHEAHTKAQGLNWANANVPKYSTQVTYEYVDLGLPSGTLWAKMNVGATSETDTGLYFAWGETEGYTASQVSGSATPHKDFSWDDYALTEDSGSTMSKYNSTDNKVVLDAEDDAASVNMGGDWHMPTKGQYEELCRETTNGFVTNAGVFTQYIYSNEDNHYYPTEITATISGWNTAGHIFFKNSYASVTDAISANDYLFIPAAGNCDNDGVYGVGEWGHVWSSSLNTDNVYSAWYFYFDSDVAGVYSLTRCYGRSVRGVIGNIDK